MKKGYIALVDNDVTSNLYYEISEPAEDSQEERATILFSHAAFLDSRMWDAQWQALSKTFRLIRYDMIGFGKSDPATGPRCRRADLLRLLAALEVTHAHFVGCSMGGELVLDLAIEDPALVDSITVVNGTPSGFAMQGEMPRYVPEMINALQQGDVATASELQLRIWVDGPARTPDQVDRQTREFAGEMNRICVVNNTWFIADSTPQEPLDPPAVDRLQTLHLPVLIMTGALDHAETRRAGQLMVAQIPGAIGHTIEGAAHVPNLEKPTEFTAQLLAFLAG